MLTLYLSLIDEADSKSKFEEIYLSYRKQMLALALSILHNEEDAEDVVHNVFLCIATKHMTFVSSIENSTDLRNYLLKATKNTALNEIKKKSRTDIPLDAVIDYDNEKPLVLSDDEFVNLLCEKMEYENVVKAIQSISEPYKDALYYHFVLELSVPDTAKHLDRKTETVKKQLQRGKKLLLELLAREEN